MLETDLRSATNLTAAQLNSENPPLLCGTELPAELPVDANRDWDRLAAVLHAEYPGDFETLEDAEAYVRERRPS